VRNKVIVAMLSLFIAGCEDFDYQQRKQTVLVESAGICARHGGLDGMEELARSNTWLVRCKDGSAKWHQ
jgi:hypothetical protein